MRVGPGGRVGPAAAAVDDLLAEAERQVHDPVLRAGVSGRVEVPGARHAGDVGVEQIAVALPHDLLHDDGHLLLGVRLPGGAPVVARAAEEGRGVHELDRLGQLAEARVGVGLVVGDHLRGVDAGERLVHGVLEQARGAQGERQVRPLHQRAQIAQDLRGQVGAQEGVGDDVVRVARQRPVAQPVALHEQIEDLRWSAPSGRGWPLRCRGKPRGSRRSRSTSRIAARPDALPPSAPSPRRVKVWAPSRRSRTKSGTSETGARGLERLITGSLLAQRDRWRANRSATGNGRRGTRSRPSPRREAVGTGPRRVVHARPPALRPSRGPGRPAPRGRSRSRRPRRACRSCASSPARSPPGRPRSS